VDPYTIAGLAGVCVILSVYFANQQDWLDAKRWQFPAANLAGSLLILMSLWDAWNLPSAVIEIAWAAISLWGLIRRHRLR
jgi:hypothetical protein